MFIIGHHIYEELRILRLEFLLQIHNKELILQKQEADAFIDEQLSTNPYYNGPKQVTVLLMAKHQQISKIFLFFNRK